MVQRQVYELFQRACRRERGAPHGTEGEICRDQDGNTAVFWLWQTGGRITAADYRCTTCISLVALCEHLAELLTGLTPEEAMAWTADRLLSLHPEIPPERQDRAALAIEAMQSAVARLRKEAFV